MALILQRCTKLVTDISTHTSKQDQTSKQLVLTSVDSLFYFCKTLFEVEEMTAQNLTENSCHQSRTKCYPFCFSRFHSPAKFPQQHSQRRAISLEVAGLIFNQWRCLVLTALEVGDRIVLSSNISATIIKVNGNNPKSWASSEAQSQRQRFYLSTWFSSNIKPPTSPETVLMLSWFRQHFLPMLELVHLAILYLYFSLEAWPPEILSLGRKLNHTFIRVLFKVWRTGNGIYQ